MCSACVYTTTNDNNNNNNNTCCATQPLRAVHLPLCVYAVMEGVGLVGDAGLLALGFRARTTSDGSRYFIFRGAAGDKQEPILFVHGVLGLVGCVPLLARLRRNLPRHTVVVPDIRHVSMRLTLHGARTVDEVAVAATAAMRQEGLRTAHVIAHSYGVSPFTHDYTCTNDTRLLMLCLLMTHPSQ